MSSSSRLTPRLRTRQDGSTGTPRSISVTPSGCPLMEHHSSLKLNADKTELLWTGTCSQLKKLTPMHPSLAVGSCTVKAADSARLLCVVISPDLTLKQHLWLTRRCLWPAHTTENKSKLEFGMYPQSMPTEWTHARTLRPWHSVRLDL